MSNYPIPQIILGKPSTGQQGDSSAQAYNKYNIHTHDINQSSNPLSLKIKPGFLVLAVDELGNQLLDLNTSILSIDSNKITLSSFPLQPSNNAVVYFIDNNNSQNVTSISAINIVVINNYITLPEPKGGLLSSDQAKYLPLDNFSGFITVDIPLSVNAFPIIIKNINKAYLYKLDLQFLTYNTSVSGSLSLLLNNINIETFNIPNTSPTSVDLNLNTLTKSTLIKENDSVTLLFNSVVSTQTKVLLAYNLYVYKV